MFNSRGPLSLFFTLFLFVGLIATVPTPPKGHAAPPKGHAAPSKGHSSSGLTAPHCPSNLKPRASKVFIGYNGFNGVVRHPQASRGGELGTVFYVTDSVDLAKTFAHGGDRRYRDYVCTVWVDAEAWAVQPKVWVPNHAPFGNAMNGQYPGAVLFTHHTNAALLTIHGAPQSVHQLGIRQSQISRLDVTVNCYDKSCFANEHHTLRYDTLMSHWQIQVRH